MLYNHQEIIVIMLLLPVVCMILVPLTMSVIWFVRTMYVKFRSFQRTKNTDEQFIIKNFKTIH